MAYELTILESKFQTLKSSANSTSVTDFYNRNIPTLNTAIDSFSSFTSSK
jgi:hypothetical protein